MHAQVVWALCWLVRSTALSCGEEALLNHQSQEIVNSWTKSLPATESWDITYETVPNVFIQNEPRANPAIIGPAPARFGLLDNSPDRWQKLINRIERLNRYSSQNTTYKLFILGRHGEGWHNVAEAYYGKKAWDDYWSKLDGNGTVIWGPDAKLTNKGVSQARRVNHLWKTEHPDGGFNGLGTGAPLPQRLYSSPLSRAMHTMAVVYGDVVMGVGRIKPVVVEGLREVIGVHTCDKRHSRSYLQRVFPLFDIEPGFSEEDELWQPDYRETKAERNTRVKKALDRIFTDTWDLGDNYIAITAHGGTIAGALHAFKHREYLVATGGVVPVLVKASRGS